MTDEGKELFEQAMRLPPKERAELAAKLVSTVNAVTEAEAAWCELVSARARRVLASELGTTTYLRKPPPTTIRFEIDAEVDLERAATWYDDQPGQVEAFLEQLATALESVRKNPAGFGFHPRTPRAMGVRRVVLREFPYYLAFLRVRTEVRVLAVAHNYRSPADGDISLEALVAVEDWLGNSGWRALSAISGLMLGATAVPLVAH